MAQKLKKARGEGDWYGIAVEDDLDSGEDLTGTPTIRILRYGESADPGYVDVSSQFGADLQAQYDDAVDLEDGTTQKGVRFYLDEADGDTDQLPGRHYRVECQFHTTGGRHPVATDAGGNLPRLHVS